jgi:hypothetical protein
MITPAIPEGCVHEEAPLLAGGADAIRSEDGVYRYWLSRAWGSGDAWAVWVMLNPSTANAFTDDNTIRRIVAFTKAWGLDGLVVVNLYGLRATDPRELRPHADPVGPANDHFIAAAIQPESLVIAAWGAHPLAARRAGQVMAAIGAAGVYPRSLGTTKAGLPRHPLFVRSDAKPRYFEMQRQAA